MPVVRSLHFDLRPDGLHQLLREFHPDRGPAVRLDRGVAAFFILAIQLFVTLIEFKLTTLAGFVLIPFGLFGKTAFAAERVLGNVISSGVKVLVLAVIVGIGSTLFSQFTTGFGGNQPTIENAMSMVLAACPCWASAYSAPVSPTASCQAVRSAALALRSGPVLRPVELLPQASQALAWQRAPQAGCSQARLVAALQSPRLHPTLSDRWVVRRARLHRMPAELGRAELLLARHRLLNRRPGRGE